MVFHSKWMTQQCEGSLECSLVSPVLTVTLITCPGIWQCITAGVIDKQCLVRKTIIRYLRWHTISRLTNYLLTLVCCSIARWCYIKCGYFGGFHWHFSGVYLSCRYIMSYYLHNSYVIMVMKASIPVCTILKKFFIVFIVFCTVYMCIELIFYPLI